MRNLAWFCIGVVFGRIGVNALMHLAYVVTIAVLLGKLYG